MYRLTWRVSHLLNNVIIDCVCVCVCVCVSGANLKGALFDNSQMNGANLRLASLKGACLRSCNLRYADMACTDLEVNTHTLSLSPFTPHSTSPCLIVRIVT